MQRAPHIALHCTAHTPYLATLDSTKVSHSLLAVCVATIQKVVSTATGEVLTARSCRPPTRMISVHWLSTELTLLFITNAGIELYSLIRGKLKHVKTAPYNIVYHWVLLSDSLLLLVDNKSVFQLFHMNHKTLSKVCRFELDVRGTSQRPTVDATQPFHRDQVVMLNVYGRMVVCFVNEAKAQLHLLSLGPSSDEMEQTHVYGQSCHSCHHNTALLCTTSHSHSPSPVCVPSIQTSTSQAATTSAA